MKKLNLNKVRIVSLRNLQLLNGGSSGCLGASQGCNSAGDTCTQTISFDNDIDCNSTSNTYQGGDGGGTFKSSGPPETQVCSQVLTECEIADI
ncbi:hypothetical protein [Kordia sp.]|uniref:hypothetical protein n=1 Tax=Kordia sp. TaxID=1965332 RepID=UPI003D2E63A7